MILARRRFLANIPLLGALGHSLAAAPAKRPGAALWTFDRLDRIGGFPAKALGHPRVIKTPVGKAVEFNGVDDAIFIDHHPLAGAETFTFEVLFRPDRGGAAEQRWFHLSTVDPKTGQDTDTRMMFEIRVIGEQWCLEALVNTPRGYQPMIDRNLLHPLGVWHQVAMVYDGQELRSYVNGVLELKGPLEFSPAGPGHSSAGARINRVFFFKGAIRQARFTPAALTPERFLKL